MEKEILRDIEKRLLHGGKAEISRKAGVSIFTVLRFFNGESTNKKVLIATKEYLNEIDESYNELNKVAVA